jgi:hypothetical protein
MALMTIQMIAVSIPLSKACGFVDDALGETSRTETVGVASPEMAQRLGGDLNKALPAGWYRRDAVGNLPGVGKRLDYAPGAGVADDLWKFAQAKADKLSGQLGADFAASIADMGKGGNHGWVK